MKKILASVLTLCLLLGCTSALAAGKLEVAQETYTAIDSYSYYGYVFAEVTNTGDKNVKFGSGIFEILNADGDALGSEDVYTSYPDILAPGETGYVIAYDSVDEAKSLADISDYTLTVSGKSSSDEAYPRLDAEGSVSEVERYGNTSYRLHALVSNNSADTAYDCVVVVAAYDETGKLLFADRATCYNEGIPAGSSLEVYFDVNDSFKTVWDEAGVKPATVQVVAYTEK